MLRNKIRIIIISIKSLPIEVSTTSIEKINAVKRDLTHGSCRRSCPRWPPSILDLDFYFIEGVERYTNLGKESNNQNGNLRWHLP